MKKTFIIAIIIILGALAIALGVLYTVTPDVTIAWVDPHTANPLIETLGINRPDTRIERLIALRTYEGEPDFNDMMKIAQVGNMEYLELDERSENYILITPLEINGYLQLYNVTWDSHDEEYKLSVTPFFSSMANTKEKKLPENYSLLLRYTRPSEPQYAVKLYQETGVTDTEGKMQYQTATYMITNTENGAPVKRNQLVKDDTNPGTESFGIEITVEDTAEEFTKNTTEEDATENDTEEEASTEE